MAADLYIHALKEPCTEKHVKEFFGESRSDGLYNIIASTPQVHVGEVSWLKAALFDDADTYIPHVVANISDIIGEDMPVIDDALIEKIKAAYSAGNQTNYEVSDKKGVIHFLNKHKGKRAFTVNW